MRWFLNVVKFEQLGSNDNNIEQLDGQLLQQVHLDERQNTDARDNLPATGTFVEGSTEKHQLTWRTREKTNPTEPTSTRGQCQSREDRTQRPCDLLVQIQVLLKWGKDGKAQHTGSFQQPLRDNGCPCAEAVLAIPFVHKANEWVRNILILHPLCA